MTAKLLSEQRSEDGIQIFVALFYVRVFTVKPTKVGWILGKGSISVLSDNLSLKVDSSWAQRRTLVNSLSLWVCTAWVANIRNPFALSSMRLALAAVARSVPGTNCINSGIKCRLCIICLARCAKLTMKSVARVSWSVNELDQQFLHVMEQQVVDPIEKQRRTYYDHDQWQSFGECCLSLGEQVKQQDLIIYIILHPSNEADTRCSINFCN